MPHRCNSGTRRSTNASNSSGRGPFILVLEYQVRAFFAYSHANRILAQTFHADYFELRRHNSRRVYTHLAGSRRMVAAARVLAHMRGPRIVRLHGLTGFELTVTYGAKAFDRNAARTKEFLLEGGSGAAAETIALDRIDN